jgi:hypothetical protein
MQLLELTVHGAQLLTHSGALLNAFEGQQHRFDLALAVDQHTTLGGTGLVGHGFGVVQHHPS